MDPLSIAASSVALIQTANFITTSLIELGKGIRDADSRVSALCAELSDLTGLIDAVDKTIKKCRPIQSDLVDDELWEQCDVVVGDCHGTLNKLRCLIERIKSPSNSKRRRFYRFHRRVRVALDLNVYGRDLVAFREKIHKSNWALQTLLQTVTVCICLDQTSSQRSILFEVGKLGTIIDEALRASHKRPGAFIYSQDHGDAKIAGNLRKLIEAATHVRSAASSRASSKADSVMNLGHEIRARNRSSTGSVRIMPPGSIEDMTEDQRYRIEAYVETMREAASRAAESSKTPPQQPVFTPSIPIAAPVATPRSPPPLQTIPEDKDMQQVDENEDDEDDEDDDDDDDDDFDGPEYCDGLRDMAKECFVKEDYAKAICFLTDALQRKRGENAGEASREIREIQHQLVLCHLFRKDWRKAAPIVESLAKGKGVLDETTCNLLHALSLAQLRDPQYSASLDTAMNTCRMALRAKKKLIKQAEYQSGADGYMKSDYYQTLGLFATIHRMRDDPVHYTMYNRRLPTTFAYIHPANEADYIKKHPRLLSTVLGEDFEGFWMDSGAAPWIYGEISELDAATNGGTITRCPTMRLRKAKSSATSPLQADFADFYRYHVDSEKEVTCGPILCPIPEVQIETDASQEVTSKTPIQYISQRSAVRRGLTRVFTNRRVQQRRSSGVTKKASLLAPSTTASSHSSGTSADVYSRPTRRPLKKAKEMTFKILPIVGLTLIFPISIPYLLWRRRSMLKKYEGGSTVSTDEYGGRIMSWIQGQTKVETSSTTDVLDYWRSPLPDAGLRYAQDPSFGTYTVNASEYRRPHEVDNNEIVEMATSSNCPQLSDGPMTPSGRALTVSDMTSIVAPSTVSQLDRLQEHDGPQVPEVLPFGSDMPTSLRRLTRYGGEVQRRIEHVNFQPWAPDDATVDTNDYTLRLPAPTPASLGLASSRLSLPEFKNGQRQPCPTIPVESISRRFELYGDHASLSSGHEVSHDAQESVGRACGTGASSSGMLQQLFPLPSSSGQAGSHLKSSLLNSGFDTSEGLPSMTQSNTELLGEVRELVGQPVATSVKSNDTVFSMWPQDSSGESIHAESKIKETMGRVTTIPEQQRVPSSSPERIAINSQCGSKTRSIKEDNFALSDPEEIPEWRQNRLSPILEWGTPMSADCSGTPRTPISFREGDDDQFTCQQEAHALASEQPHQDQKEARMCPAALPNCETHALGENLAGLTGACLPEDSVTPNSNEPGLLHLQDTSEPITIGVGSTRSLTGRPLVSTDATRCLMGTQVTGNVNPFIAPMFCASWI